MAVPDYCVPQPCTFTTPPCMFGAQEEWCLLKNRAVTNNTVYSVGYLTGKYFPFVTEGVTTIIENEVTSWFLRFTIVSALPYFITLLLLLIILMITNVVSILIGVLLIIVMIVMAVLAILWVLYDTSNSLVTIRNDVEHQINSNWSKYGNSISRNIGDVIVFPCGSQCYKCPDDNCTCIPNICPTAAATAAEDTQLLEKYRILGTTA